MINEEKPVKFWLITIPALLSFSVMFVYTGLGKFDFWWWMSSNLLVFISLSTFLYKDYLPGILDDLRERLWYKLFLGISSAVVLYLVFYAGNFFSSLMFENAGNKIQEIYRFKGDASSFRILLLMLLVIGPGEELFWRGFVQEQLMKRHSPFGGFVFATVLYALVHVVTGNFMLIVAALVAGIFWGWMYMRYRSVTANIISHVIWDITIFILLPIS
ncbi:MAG: CPBP family intramembrane metalloprotease [Bacteroidales bacterium]|nr:CPBP family intramembrane metalloprotease [Bacteroidales bacterium]